MEIHPFIAVDVGNARIKLGLFADDARPTGIPEPTRTLSLVGDAPKLDAIVPWLGPIALEGPAWRIASVNRPAASRLIQWLNEHRPKDQITLLASDDLPLTVRLQRPDMVGIDRLVDAVAVNRLREASRPAAIVDVGSAITVDLVSADGAFLGGAILPGIQMSARALHEFTDLLPLLDTSELSEPPPALGVDTVSAMQSGLFWGAVGAIRQLIEELHRTATANHPSAQNAKTPSHAKSPQVFMTGGAGQSVAELLGPDAVYVANLTLAGIALATPVVP